MIFTYQTITGSDIYHIISPKTVAIIDVVLVSIFIGILVLSFSFGLKKRVGDKGSKG